MITPPLASLYVRNLAPKHHHLTTPSPMPSYAILTIPATLVVFMAGSVKDALAESGVTRGPLRGRGPRTTALTNRTTRPLSASAWC